MAAYFTLHSKITLSHEYTKKKNMELYPTINLLKCIRIYGKSMSCDFTRKKQLILLLWNE